MSFCAATRNLYKLSYRFPIRSGMTVSWDIKKIFRHTKPNHFIVLLIIVLVLIASRDLLKPGYFSIHDDLQVGRLYQMELCFRDFQIPCRWVPDMGYGYGYPLYNFYPSLPYYFGIVFHFIGFSIMDATKIMFGASFLISAILMYIFGRELWGKWGGLVSSALYLFAPYHSVDIYVRGAMNEAWALALLPGWYWSAYRLLADKNIRNIAWFALFTGLILLSHNLMAMIFAPTIGVFCLLLVWQRKIKIKDILPRYLIGGLWGLGLAAFFTLPVIFETKYVHVETMLMGYFNYLAHYVSIGKLLFTRFWGYGSSGWLQETGMPFQVGIPQWPLAFFVFVVGVVMFVKRKVNREFLILNSFFFLLFLGTLFLVHPRSVPIWILVKPLEFLQFPWRFLTLVIFAISILGGGIIYIVQSFPPKADQPLVEKCKVHNYGGNLPGIVAILIIILTVGLNFTFFKAEKIFPMTDEVKLFSAKGWNKLQTDAIFDYLPKTAKFPPAGPAPDQPTILSGQAILSQVDKGSNWYKFNIEVKENSVVQIPLYDFPKWLVTVNQKRVDYYNEGDLGLVTIDLTPGEYEVKVALENTPIRSLGNIISLTSWSGLLLLFAGVFRNIDIRKQLLGLKLQCCKHSSKKE